MKFSLLLPFAVLSSAIVIPDDRVMNQVALEPHQPAGSILDKLPPKEELVQNIEDVFSTVLETTETVFDEVLEGSSKLAQATVEALDEEYFDVQGWLGSAYTESEEQFSEMLPQQEKPHHGHHGPHHGHKSNLTVYQLIAGSKYTTKLAKLISKYDDLVELLNGTEANYTIFAPTDKAFAKLPKHIHPSEELLKQVLSFHVSSDFYPAGRVLASPTIPTLYESELLGGPQRLRTSIGLRGLTVNFYSKVVAINIFGSNGVIHAVDSVLIPPPKAAKILDFLPGDFSTLELALIKTGLYAALNNTDTHVGGTLFAPTNFAFKRLGPKINAFLFSQYGEKYLKALLKYHIVANQTLYSDAFYGPKKDDAANAPGRHQKHLHFDLPTLLKERFLSIDIISFGRFVKMKINAFNDVALLDGVAKDGVIHIVSKIIIPPKQGAAGLEHWDGEELDEEDLKARLEPFVSNEENMEL